MWSLVLICEQQFNENCCKHKKTIDVCLNNQLVSDDC